MDPKRLSDTLSVTAQLTPDDVAAAASLGFRSIICNRPDGESDGQPDFAAINAAARSHGMTAHHLPIIADTEASESDIRHFGELLDELPAPALAYCRSGTRSATLWALHQATREPVSGVLGTLETAGCGSEGLGRLAELPAVAA